MIISKYTIFTYNNKYFEIYSKNCIEAFNKGKIVDNSTMEVCECQPI